MGDFADRLIDRLDRAYRWPMTEDRDVWARVALYRAMRESDREYLARYVDRDAKKYKVDPVAPMISRAFSSLVFGRRPEFEAATPADQKRLEHVVRENKMAVELNRNQKTCGSEGEVWWRIYVDPAVADAPLVEFHSRLGVVPLWVGRKLKAVAFVSRLEDLEDESHVAWRHFEVHDAECVENVLYKGTASAGERGTDGDLGDRVALTEHYEVENLRSEPWEHGMEEMLAGRIVNQWGSDPHLGVSDYHDVEDLLLELNETLATGAANRKLTARKRMVVPATALDENRELPDDQEVLVAEALDDADMAGGGGGNQGSAFKTLEYSFDAQALIAYANDLAMKAVTRVGMNAQFAGLPTEGTEGAAATGVALRIRLIPSINAGEDRAQDWDDQLPVIFVLLQRLDEADPGPEGINGFGRPWSKAIDAPSIERGTALPEDETEEASRHSTLVESLLESRRTAIEQMHPDWDAKRIDEELDLIREELSWAQGGFAGTLPTDDDDSESTEGDPSEPVPGDDEDPDVQAEGVGDEDA